MDDILIDFPRRPLWRRAWTRTEQKVFAALVAVLGAFALVPVVAGSGPRDGDLVVANTHLSGSQSSPVVAALPDGKVVVVWEGAGPGDDDGVFARIRDPVGDAGFTDAEFLVNEETHGIQGEPAVAADADGNFLVAWVGPSADKQDGGQDVFTRLFNSTGTPQRGETEIHALPEAGASSPAAEGEEPSPPPEEPSPAPEEPSPPPEEPSPAPEEPTPPPEEEPSPPPEEPSPPPEEEPSPPPEEEPTPPPEEEPTPPPEEEPGPAPEEPNPVIGDQSNPAVAALDGGRFAVAYEGSGTEVLSVTPPPPDDPLGGVAPASDDQGIFLRYTGLDNEPSEVLVNSTSTDGQQRDPAVAASGSTVMVLWSGPGSGDEDVYAATVTGTVATEPFVVNTTTAGDQDEPAVVARGTDDFVAVWTGPDGDGDGIFLRGLQQPPSELLVNNLLITGDQRHPAVTISGSGLAVAWDGPGDADAGGIHVRRLDAGLNEGDVPTVIAVTTTADAVHPALAGNSAADYTVAFQGTGTASDVFVRRYAVNDAPVAAADMYDVEEDTTLSVDDDPAGVLDNDSDVDDDPITASVVSPPATGTLAFRPDGTFDYTPEPDANGTVTFTYQASDGAADSSPAVVTLNVIPFNDGGPTAMADAYAATEDIPFSVDAAGGVLANDDDPDDDSLKATLVESTTKGTLVLHEDGSFDYTTLLNSCEDDTFKYEAADADYDSQATVTISVTCVVDPPKASDDLFNTVEDKELEIDPRGVLANDEREENQAVFAHLQNGLAPEHGTLESFDTDGGFLYVPPPDFHDTVSFTYFVSESQSSPPPPAPDQVATVTIIVGSELDTPVATDDAFQVDEDSELMVPKETGVLANDNDPDDGDLTATVITQPSHGTLGAFEPDGSFHYEPFLDFNGIDLFTYEVENQSGKASTGRVQILVGAQGDIVIATDDHYQVSEGVSLTVPAPGILTNDIDSDGDKLGLSVVEGVAHGKLELNQDGSFLYAPAESFNGSDGFTYRVKDSDGNQATARVAIAVRPADKPPPDEPTTMPGPVAPPPPPPPPPPAVEIKTTTPPAPVDLPEPDAPVVPITVPAPAPPPPPTVALLPEEEKKGREVPVKPLAAAGGGGIALAGLLAGLASRRRHALGPLDDSPL